MTSNFGGFSRVFFRHQEVLTTDQHYTIQQEKIQHVVSQTYSSGFINLVKLATERPHKRLISNAEFSKSK